MQHEELTDDDYEPFSPEELEAAADGVPDEDREQREQIEEADLQNGEGPQQLIDSSDE